MLPFKVLPRKLVGAVQAQFSQKGSRFHVSRDKTRHLFWIEGFGLFTFVQALFKEVQMVGRLLLAADCLTIQEIFTGLRTGRVFVSST